MQREPAPIGKLVVVGLGLIGSSLALAARQRGLAGEVIGVSRRSSTLDLALQQGVIDRVASSLTALAAELQRGDVVVIGVPTLTVPAVLDECAAQLDSAVTITDVASVKGSVVAAACASYGAAPSQLVPGHPIAGSEKSGVNAADGGLFVGHRVILTPHADSGADHLARVQALWQGCGAMVTEMSAADHDEILAATSHLPHFLAFSLVDTLAGLRANREIFRYAAGGFRDFTRIAASDPVMWRDIALANRSAVLQVLDQLTADFARLRGAIDAGDGSYLLDLFTRAQSARQHFGQLLEQGLDSDTMSAKPLTFRLSPGGSAVGTIRVPGDKSISHRSIMLGALAEGMTEVTGFLEGEDSIATLRAFRAMGVQIEGPQQGRVVVHGVGLHGLKAPSAPLDVGNAGTGMRLLAGVLAGQPFDSVLVGDASLSGRPMGRVADPLAEMGAVIATEAGGRPPLRITGGQMLKPLNYTMPMASAQVKSCLLLAGLYCEGETSVVEPAPTRDHTERMLRGFGYSVVSEQLGGGATRVSLRGGGTLRGGRIDVPADISSAAFFMVAAAITPGSDITLQHIGINPTRIGVLNILRAMGADITLSNEAEVGGEPVADIRVRYAPLRGIAIDEAQVPLAIDEFPVLFVAAACAEGETVLTGAHELRVKESDRIQAMADGLQILGVAATPTADGIRIVGGAIGGGRVASCHDHRIAMAFAIASLRASSEIVIDDCNNVATSFPTFAELALQVGIKLSVE